MTTAQAKRIARWHGLPFTFDVGYWSLGGPVDEFSEGAGPLPLFFTAAALASISMREFHRYCYLAQLEVPRDGVAA